MGDHLGDRPHPGERLIEGGFLDALGQSFAAQAGRHARQDELDPLIEAWTVERDHVEVQQQLQAAGVAAGAVLDVTGVREDPELKHRGSIVFVDHPETGRFPHTRTAWRSRRGNDGVSGPAPLYGEATDYVLHELLGRDSEQASRLIASGAVATEPAAKS